MDERVMRKFVKIFSYRNMLVIDQVYTVLEPKLDSSKNVIQHFI